MLHIPGQSHPEDILACSCLEILQQADLLLLEPEGRPYHSTALSCLVSCSDDLMAVKVDILISAICNLEWHEKLLLAIKADVLSTTTS